MPITQHVSYPEARSIGQLLVALVLRPDYAHLTPIALSLVTQLYPVAIKGRNLPYTTLAWVKSYVDANYILQLTPGRTESSMPCAGLSSGHVEHESVH